MVQTDRVDPAEKSFPARRSGVRRRIAYWLRDFARRRDASPMVAIGGAIVFGLALVLGNLGTQSQRAAAQSDYNRSLQLLMSARATLSLAQDLETGQRGFLLTREDRYLAPYRAASAQIPAAFSRLRALTADNPRQLANVARLEDALSGKRAEIERTLSLARAGRTREAIDIVRADGGRQLMDRVRDAMALIVAEETRVLEQRRARSIAAANWNELYQILVAGIGGVLLAFSALMSLLALRADARVAAERSRRLLAAQLARSERRFTAVTDIMPEIVWSAAANGDFVSFNRRWRDYTGAAESREAWFAQLHPDDRSEIESTWSQSLASGAPFEATCRIRGADGGYRWFLCRALPSHDPTGVLDGWYASCADIHENRQNLEARELLSQELSHRIKNIFAVIGSLISLSARAHPEQRAFADNLRDRINALGRAHDFVRPHGDEPEKHPRAFIVFMNELLGAHAYRAPDRIHIEGDDIAFGDSSATPLALFFHELATNAAKYGALSTPGGKVSVTCRREGDRFVVVWAESGGPVVMGPPTREGFGTHLARKSVESQLGGRVEKVWALDGLRVTVDLPADTL